MDKSEIERLAGQLSMFDDQSNEPPGPSMSPMIADIKASARQEAAVPLIPADPVLSATLEETGTPVFVDVSYGLNKEQWEAVSSPEPAVAVMAGPGTGKTKTLVYRIAYLVEKCGVHPARITAVTFTNKAAKEMRIRLEKHFGKKRTAGAMTIGTFHSICLQILSQWRGKNNAVILDEYQALSIIEEILKSMQLELSPREVMRGISLMKNGISPAEDKKKSEVPAGVYESYCSQLKRYGVMDYDDILLEVLTRFENGNTGDISGSGRENPFSYLLVDEFQDINEIQYRLIKEWSRQSESIFIIGDPDQSIYGFRGSDFRYFARFQEDFPAIRQVRLTQNYRSTPEIIASAASVISRQGAGERTRSLEATRGRGVGVRLIETKDEFSEAVFVAKEINRMVGGIDMLDAHSLVSSPGKRPVAKHPQGFSDIALLYRTNHQAQILEQCLLKEGIPYVVAGREDFLSDKLVRQAIAFFRFLLNPGDLASLWLCLKAETSYSAALNQKVMESYAAGKKDPAALAKILEAVRLPVEPPDQPGNFPEMLRKYATVIQKEKPWKIMDSWIHDHNLSGVDAMELLLNTAVMYDRMPSLMQNLVLGRESDVVRRGSKVYSPDPCGKRP
jgi:superfamily I DNA/RNA helicase